MAPQVLAGDIVVTAPVTVAELRPGDIILFDDVTRRRPVLHRVEGRDEHGAVVTKGDANAVPDSTPVQPEAVTGRLRLRIPYVGLPAIAVRRAPVASSSVAVLGLLGAVVLVRRSGEPTT